MRQMASMRNRLRTAKPSRARAISSSTCLSPSSQSSNGRSSSHPVIVQFVKETEHCQYSHKLPPFISGRVIDDSQWSLLRNGMTNKRIGAKRHRSGALAHGRKSVLNTRMRDHPVQAETEMPLTIKVRNFFRQAFGTANIRSFQLCLTNSGYYTVYLKDRPATDARP